LIQNEDVNSSFSVFKRKKSTALLGQKRGEQGSENYSVVGADLSGTSTHNSPISVPNRLADLLAYYNGDYYSNYNTYIHIVITPLSTVP
jgi:hypothetical protein